MKKGFSALLLVTIISIITVGVAAATPLLAYPSNLINEDLSWDQKPHNLPGLLMEQGDGYIDFVFPRSPDNRSVWGLHGLVTFYDAEVTNVIFYGGFNILEVDGNNGLFGGVPFDDEIDWFGDGHQVLGGLVSNPSQLEMWLATNSARDAFTAEVTYGFCPRMVIDNLDPSFFGSPYPQTVYRLDSTDVPYGTVVPLTDCMIVAIDVKPGSDPSCFNSDGHGVIPVAIFGSADLNVRHINPETLLLDGAPVATRGRSHRLLVAYEKLNNDPYLDMVVKFVDTDAYNPSDEWATLNASLMDGTHIQGTGDICITQ